MKHKNSINLTGKTLDNANGNLHMKKTAAYIKNGASNSRPLPITELQKAAREVLKRSYVPYSGRAVGAALLGSDNIIYTGGAVENANSAISLCAERAAVAKAVSRGCRHYLAIAVAGRDFELAVPCVSCRQVLAEFSPGIAIILEDENGNPVIYKLTDLLPITFDLRIQNTDYRIQNTDFRDGT
jgi:cytidine deaminase